MISLLAKLFIKETPSAADPRVRQRYGMLCGMVGVALNVLLFAAKLILGSVSGSIAISADAFNNLSDAGTSVITLFGFKLAQQKPDTEHPFGHGRMEYIAGLVVAMAILLMGIELLKSSVDKILTPAPVTFSLLGAAILIGSILVKLYMFRYNRRFGTLLDSSAMRAASIDSLSDCAATTAVLVSTAIAHFTGVPIDGWCGLLVAVFILFAGFRAIKETINPLLGQPPTQAFIEEIESIVWSRPEVIGVHDLIVHDYGPGRRMVSLHAEVAATGDILLMHDAIDNIEKELREKLGCLAVIHMDPVITDDTLTNDTRERVAEVVKGLDERATIHDFRMVTGPTHTNVIFDVVVPFDVKLTEREIKQRIMHMVRALDGSFYAVVEVDRSIAGKQ